MCIGVICYPCSLQVSIQSIHTIVQWPGAATANRSHAGRIRCRHCAASNKIWREFSCIGRHSQPQAHNHASGNCRAVELRCARLQLLTSVRTPPVQLYDNTVLLPVPAPIYYKRRPIPFISTHPRVDRPLENVDL